MRIRMHAFIMGCQIIFGFGYSRPLSQIMKTPLRLCLAATALLAFSGALRAQTAPDDKAEQELKARAYALQAKIFTIDTHEDVPSAMIRRPTWDITQWHDRATDNSQVDFPRMREGGLKSAFYAVYLGQGPRDAAGLANARDRALAMFMNQHEMLAKYPDQAELALTADDGPRIMATGKRAIYLSIENGYVIGKDLTLIKTYYDMGCRMMSIAHFSNNDLGDSSTDPNGEEWHGLSPLGKQVVTECNKLGIILDGSHANDTVVRDLLDLSKVPIMLSHSDCHDVWASPRNVPDALLKRLADKGGTIQMNMYSAYIMDIPVNPELNTKQAELMAKQAADPDKSDAAEARHVEEIQKLRLQYPTKEATLPDFMKQVFHAIQVAGIDHVGIGSDMDGGGGFTGMEDVSKYPMVTMELLRAGYSEGDIAKIWGLNTLRVMRDVQDYARKNFPVAPEAPRGRRGAGGGRGARGAAAPAASAAPAPAPAPAN